MSRFQKILQGLVFTCSISSMALADQNDRVFNLDLQQSQRGSFNLNLQELNQESLQRNFAIRIIDPFNRDDLDKLVLTTSNGRRIKFQVAVSHNKEDFIIGSPIENRQILISFVDIIDRKFVLTFSVKDQSGNFIIPSSNQEIYVFDSNGREMCFNIEPIEHSGLPIHIGIAADVSGSMTPYSLELQDTLQQFMEHAPKNALCSVVDFNDRVFIHQRAKSCHFSTISLRNPNGGTRIYPALYELYSQLHRSAKGLKLALVISDGVSETTNITAAKSAKKGITTFVNWLGDYDTQYPLKQFADAEVFGSAASNGLLGTFFSKANANLHHQYVATQCEK